MANAVLKFRSRVAILGSGPAALMAADVISAAGHSVTVFEKRKGPGRKLLIAGSSGLNIGNSLPQSEFIRHYRGGDEGFWERVFRAFPSSSWLGFIESLGLKTFEGTSGRHFVDAMDEASLNSLKPSKGSKLLSNWIRRLRAQAVQFSFESECTGFTLTPNGQILLSLSPLTESGEFSAVCFCLGGGSWEPEETPLRWPEIFKSRHLGFETFVAANCGFQVAWPQAFLTEAEGLPLKTFSMTSPRGTKKGEAVITSYGIEGTPVYTVGITGSVLLDLKPDLDLRQVLVRLSVPGENLSPIRRVKKYLGLCPVALALVFHLTPKEILSDLNQLCERIKRFPLELLGPQPLTEAISSSGGLKLTELDEGFMLRKFPGVFAAGEMLDWDAPTGGFLIQACVSQGYLAGQSICRFLEPKKMSAR